MTSLIIYSTVGIFLFAIGLAAVLIRREMFYRLLALNVCGAGLFLLMVALARLPVDAGKAAAPDPILHALVLTGIVVAVSATALGLAILRKLERTAASADEQTGEGKTGGDA